MLGEGGMGTVYRAYDKELDREVALKLLKPSVSTEERALDRFKREIRLASKITHKNVLRIHDLGDVGGTKYISMHYVEGEDLSKLMKREGPLPVDRVLKITEQLCQALQAAHAEGVVHRDLKPHNIMLDQDGNVYVADFGLARSVELTPDAASMTGTGMVIGTPRYMSPEQIKGEKVDQRSDLYSLGVIIYEMLTNQSPFADTWDYESLFKRIHQPPSNPQAVNPDAPDYLAAIVMKCLQPNPALRYRSASEILEDLQRQRVRLPLWNVARRLATARATWLILIVLVTGLLIWWFGRPWFKPGPSPSAAPAPVVAILPMENVTGDATLDWMSMGLAQLLITDLAESKVIRPVSPDRLFQIMKDLKLLDQQRYDPVMLKQIAEFSSAKMILTGRFFKDGDNLRVDAQLRDLPSGHDLLITAQGERNLPSLVEKLTQKIREQLNLPTQSLAAATGKGLGAITTSSEGALKLYYQGLALIHQGNRLEAVRLLEQAVKEDTRFAMAYAKLAETYHKLGYADRAEQYANQALELSGNLSVHELYNVTAIEATVTNNHTKAIDAYQKLIESFPNDPESYLDVASVYETTGGWDRALENYRKALELDPKYVDALTAVGRIQLRKGNAQEALKPLSEALSLNIGLNNQQGRADVMHAMGVAHRLLREYEAALRYYRESLEIKRSIGDQRGLAATLSEIGVVHQVTGRYAEAKQSYQAALEVSQKIGDAAGQGRYLNNLGSLAEEVGRSDEALSYYRKALGIATERGAKAEIANRLNNIGRMYFLKGQYQDAASSYHRALDTLRETPDRRGTAAILVALGDLASRQGEYDEALKHQLEALKIWRELQNGEWIASTTLSISSIFESQGRYVAALKSREEALTTFTALGARYDLPSALSVLGHTYGVLGAYDQAAGTLQKAEQIAQEVGKEELQAEVLVYRGELKRFQGQLHEAQSLLSRAVEMVKQPDKKIIAQIQLGLLRTQVGNFSGATAVLTQAVRQAEEVGLKPLVVEAKAGLAQAYLRQKKYAWAARELSEAIKMAERLGLRASLWWCHSLAARLAQAQGQVDQALKHYQQALTLVDWIHQEAASSQYGQTFLQRQDIQALLQDARAFYKQQGREKEIERWSDRETR
jgi:tetratricopeptide (TPR) repeat protein/predicted Ser/Thr protein kinase